MTERLADISARIEGVRQLGAVVNAMKGVAAARAHAARAQVAAVDSYSAAVAGAMAQALGGGESAAEPSAAAPGHTGLLVFCAEQGFAGAFSERVLDSIEDRPALGPVFLIGTRGQSVAVARGITPVWTAALPAQTPSIPKLADAITTAILGAVAAGRMACLDVISTAWTSGRPTVQRRALFPLDLSKLPAAAGPSPLLQLAPQALIDGLGRNHFHALVCRAALHAFAAENEARMEAMASAGAQIARELEAFRATLRRVRQEAITAEIIELGAGAACADD